ncbi:hypothetical protein C9994_06400 [Marivirga lumbricoides]|uniref:Methyltransferase FkbM domain-containing protein n=1 Tax=Marivirga lumbricoides TaxID=1046115 RepID=A0A2T4DS73_9BACT|nr:hypothetical protein C9994_06400 [Marivirga lumbricoides]
MRSILRRLIYSNQFIYNLYFDHGSISNLTLLDKKLKYYILKMDCKSFVQIGANDGFSNDPLYKFIRRYKLTGIFVEPQKEVFEKLKKLHKHRGLYFENSAVGLENGNMNLYSYNFTNARWANGLISFEKDHLLTSLKTSYVKKNALSEGINIDKFRTDELIGKKEVKVYDFNSLMRKYLFKNVDIIAVDVEGFEPKLIPSIDLAKFQPKIFLFEHRHLSEEDSILIYNHFISYNYEVVECEYDSLAIRK